MLATMSPELQKQFEDSEAYQMWVSLKEMFQARARHEQYVTTKALTTCKMAPGTPVSAHVLKMKGYIDTLEKLGIAIPQGLAIDLILGSLPESFDSFIMTYNMNALGSLLLSCMACLRMLSRTLRRLHPFLWFRRGRERAELGRVSTRTR